MTIPTAVRTITARDRASSQTASSAVPRFIFWLAMGSSLRVTLSRIRCNELVVLLRV
jgi:hypothetical protein